MTVAPPEADTAQERETAALEAAIVLAVTAALAKALSDITSWLRGEWAKGDGPGWMAAKKTAAARLRALRVNLSPALERSLPKAAALGAAHADSPLPDGHDPLGDPLVMETIDGIDAAVRAKLARAADHLVREPVHTDTQVDDAIGRIDAARGEAEAQVGTAVTRTHAEGLVAAAEEAGLELAWQAERDSCFVPSTRVLTPSILASDPLAATQMVPGEPLNGLALDPPALSVGQWRNPSLFPASTVARPVRDRYRNVELVTSREYVGEVITIRTATGQEVTGTPNHPIATPDGWVALGLLAEGDDVFCRVSGERVLGGIDPDDYNAPATIQEVSEAFPVAARSVPTSPVDFHGDGSGSDVHVVWTDGLLGDDVQAKAGQHRGELTLKRRDVQAPSLHRLRALLLGCDALHPALAGDAVGNEPAVQPRPAHAHRVRDVLHRLASVVAAAKLGRIRRRARILLDPVHLEPVSDQRLADSEEFCQLLAGMTGVIEASQIVSVRRSDFRGHVLNLQTREGWYFADGILAHNCLSCASMAGSVRDSDGLFRAVREYPARPIPWMAAGVTSPPLHAHCRCSIRPNTAGLAEGLAREAARSVARGWSAYDSLPARLQALDRVLRDTRLPKTVRARAAQDKARGRFTRGPFPGTRPTRPTGSRTRSKAA